MVSRRFERSHGLAPVMRGKKFQGRGESTGFLRPVGGPADQRRDPSVFVELDSTGGATPAMIEGEGERMDGFPPSYRIYNEDCLRINDLEAEAVFDLIYLEPPAECDFAGLLMPRLELIAPHLSELGFLLVHVDRRRASEAKRHLDRLGLSFKGDIIWTFRQRAVKMKALQNQHDTILVYSANPFYYPKRFLLAQSLVGPSSSERTGYPTQKPIDLLKRIINRFDEYHRIQTVLDPFMGSGTALVAALELGKSAAGFDTSALACRIADKRLDQSLPASRQMLLELE